MSPQNIGLNQAACDQRQIKHIANLHLCKPREPARDKPSICQQTRSQTAGHVTHRRIRQRRNCYPRNAQNRTVRRHKPYAICWISDAARIDEIAKSYSRPLTNIYAGQGFFLGDTTGSKTAPAVSPERSPITKPMVALAIATPTYWRPAEYLRPRTNSTDNQTIGQVNL